MEKMMTDEDIRNLTDGLLEIYQKPLVDVSTSLNELTKKQKTLIEVVNNKNQELQALQSSQDLNKMFSDIVRCREQLVVIKKQMLMLHEKSVKLKARAQHVATYTKNRRDARLADLDNEQRLIGSHKS